MDPVEFPAWIEMTKVACVQKTNKLIVCEYYHELSDKVEHQLSEHIGRKRSVDNNNSRFL